MNNRILDPNGNMDAVMHERLELLSESFNAFRSEYGMQLHVKDFSGYMVSHPLLGEFTESFLFHENSFCSYVKSFPNANETCVVTSNELLMRHLKHLAEQRSAQPFRSHLLTSGYYGVCWCGIGEFVYPICHNGTVIGALLAGSFACDDKRRSHGFDRLCKRYGMDRAKLASSYAECVERRPSDMAKIEAKIALFAEYLSMLAEYYIEYSLIAEFSAANGAKSTRHRIINLAIEYISKNLTRKISVADMAVYCMCSRSTLNHLFSSVVGRTIPEFVAIQRVNRAKYMILNTSLTIEQISTQCGFSSCAYFSVVFKKLTELTPTEYRERMLGRADENIAGIL